jgi:mannose-6-phosphate isomerase-like protein (cupin superfamily)
MELTVKERKKGISEDRRTCYESWIEDTLGLDRITGYFAGPLGKLPLKPWRERGFDAAFVDMNGAESLAGMFVGEIAPGKSSTPTRQLYDEIIYVIAGSGTATINTGTKTKTFEWGPRSLFSIPLNCPYQLHNGSGREPARFISVNTLPIVHGIYRDSKFIYGTDYNFHRVAEELQPTDAILFEPDDAHKITAVDLYDTLFVPDILALKTCSFSERGDGTRAVYIEMAGSVLSAHVCEVPANRFFNPHRHGPSGFVFTLEGSNGYSLMWPDDGDMERFDWPKDDIGLIVPPNMWWHGHFAVGERNTVQLAIKLMSRLNSLSHLYDNVHKTVKDGGTVLRFQDLAPDIRDRIWGPFVAACEEHGHEAIKPKGQ